MAESSQMVGDMIASKCGVVIGALHICAQQPFAILEHHFLRLGRAACVEAERRLSL